MKYDINNMECLSVLDKYFENIIVVKRETERMNREFAEIAERFQGTPFGELLERVPAADVDETKRIFEEFLELENKYHELLTLLQVKS